MRGNVEGAQLCLAQTKGLWKGFLALGSDSRESNLKTRTMVPQPVLTTPDRRAIQFLFAREIPQLKSSTRAIASAQATLPSIDEPTKSCARSALG